MVKKIIILLFLSTQIFGQSKLHEWNFENSSADDVIGSNDLTLQNQSRISMKSKEYNYALNMDGVDDYATAGAINHGNVFSISGYFFYDGSSDINTIYSNIADVGGDNGFSIYVNTYSTTDGRIRIECSEAGTTQHIYSATGVIEANTWYHFVFILNVTTGNKTVYLDGSEINMTEASDDNSFEVDGQTVDIGRFATGGGYFGGVIDDIAIWNDSLTANQITSLYNTDCRLCTAEADSLFDVHFIQTWEDNTSGYYLTSEMNSDWNNPWVYDRTDSLYIIDIGGTHGNVARVFFAADTFGLGLGGVQIESPTGYEFKEVYFSYELYFIAEWDVGNGIKLPGIAGYNSDHYNKLERCTDNTTEGFTSTYMTENDSSLKGYMYHQDRSEPNCYGDGLIINGFQFDVDKWYRITQRLVVNDIGSSNGIQETFISEIGASTDSMYYQYTNFDLSHNSIIATDYMKFYTFYGGDDHTYDPDWNVQMYFDNIVLYEYADTTGAIPKNIEASASGRTLTVPCSVTRDETVVEETDGSKIYIDSKVLYYYIYDGDKYNIYK